MLYYIISHYFMIKNYGRILYSVTLLLRILGCQIKHFDNYLIMRNY